MAAVQLNQQQGGKAQRAGNVLLGNAGATPLAASPESVKLGGCDLGKRSENAAKARQDMRVTSAQPKPSATIESVAKELLTPAVQYAELHGLLYAKPALDDQSLASQCPVALLPFPLPEQAFNVACALSVLWNKLVDAVARDLPWLYATLEPAAKADPFTERLLKMSKDIHAEGLRQPLMLGIHRSDYMLHERNNEMPRFLQVELNTIASSMASHSVNAHSLHHYMLSRYGSSNDPVALAIREHFGVASGKELLHGLPQNDALRLIPAAMAWAHRGYSGRDSSVLFVVQEGEKNFADQRWLEYALWQQHGVSVVRRSLAEIHREAWMDESTGGLRLAGEEISVVYFRAGYSPDDYPSEAEWEARKLIEQSLAIKCPSVDYQLVGAKKVQQALARSGAVERFMAQHEAEQLRSCFAGLWGLGPGEDDASIIEMACRDPEGFVLKPQREGGGNNFYGDQVATKLKELLSEERAAYILMQRILPKQQSSVMTRAGTVQIMPGISEFGFYSVYLGDGRRSFMSEHAGHLVRTKAEGVDEGGVAAGYAVISSPFLVK
eukprot:TRINITY_DN4193_c1_g4_i3.p1 TRINITY_DN4193_c1_g4~~TRINITY_DN4193_c1_g4_i3.p1  ORF type:complete len:552 (-),score=131.53 TRINITY_DN4193_c1_g4_i3:36-1691(-)